jgi:hypothetical protein
MMTRKILVEDEKLPSNKTTEKVATRIYNYIKEQAKLMSKEKTKGKGT